MYPRRMPGSHSSATRSARLLHMALVGLLVVTTAFVVSCRRRGAPIQKGNPAVIASAELQRPLPPLKAVDKAVTLSLRGQADAELLVPVGATTARPLVAVLFPSTVGLRQQCESLGQAIRTEAFVLCQTTRIEQQSAATVDAEDDTTASALRIALHMARRKFGNYVASKEFALVGVGSAADALAPIVRQAPDFFGRVAFLDGGFRLWTSVDSARFVRAGGKALLASCTREACRNEAMRVVATVRASGTLARLDPEVGTLGVAGAPGDPPGQPHLLLRWLLDAEAGLGRIPSIGSTPNSAPHPSSSGT